MTDKYENSGGSIPQHKCAYASQNKQGTGIAAIGGKPQCFGFGDELCFIHFSQGFYAYGVAGGYAA